jgi:hypothetical protein
MTTETVKETLKSQYHAALEMLREPIEICPEELWTAGKHPRQFWRISHHTLFFADYYLESEQYMPSLLERDPPSYDEEGPDDPVPYTRQELLDYWQVIDDFVDAKVDALDLESQESGFSWYKNFPKFDHQVMNIRHIQEHAGQLRDRILQAGGDPAWVGKGRRRTGSVS